MINLQEQYELPKNFLKFVEICEKDNHEVVMLKQTYEKIWFTLDGYKFDFWKMMKDVKNFYQFCLMNIATQKKVEAMNNGSRK